MKWTQFIGDGAQNFKDAVLAQLISQSISQTVNQDNLVLSTGLIM